jgi:hypothetical protein
LLTKEFIRKVLDTIPVSIRNNKSSYDYLMTLNAAELKQLKV